MLPLISIIVPVYNVERFIDRCIQSIINQTYKNLEIILIDDGSTDSSLAICQKYRNSDKRIKIIKKTNGGVSSARNIGLLHANGQYINFVDSDDYLDNSCLDKLYQALINYDCDISCSNIICESVSGEKIESLRLHKKVITFTIENYDMYSRSVYNKLFSRKCLDTKDGYISFDESLHYGEDALFTINAFLNAKKIVRIPDELYHYVIHGTSAMHNFSHKSLTEIEAWSKIITILSPFPKAKKEAEAQYSLNAQRILINVHRYQSNNIKLQLKILDKVKKYRNEVIKSEYITFKNKMYFFIFSLSPQKYIKALHLFKKVKNNIKRSSF